MDTLKAEAIARIKCDIGVENVLVRPISHKGWAVVGVIDSFHAEQLYTAKTEQECYDLIRQAREEN